MTSQTRKCQQLAANSDKDDDTSSRKHHRKRSGKDQLNKCDRRFDPISSNSDRRSKALKLEKLVGANDGKVQKIVNKLKEHYKDTNRTPGKNSLKHRPHLLRVSHDGNARTRSLSHEIPMLMDKEEVIAGVSYCRRHLHDPARVTKLVVEK
ncbi:hypothetical protein CHUAL_012661 [Chamberlinius hualienensis]